jgi:catechol 2,3-dioxygenase-like lactoylglutathione lyase family enzyme
MRLRQICLVTSDLQRRADELTGVLGLSVAYRDPAVARYGLHNVVAPVGNDFLEIVSPTTPGTAAGRYLERRGGDGGYMVILQADDALTERQRLASMGVRVVETIDRPTYQATHFHPGDTGGILLSIDSVPGADWRDPDCDWLPAGPDWRTHRREAVTTALIGAELQSDDPGAFAALWSRLLGIRVEPDLSLRLSNARLRFVPAVDGRGRGLGGIELAAADRPRALAEAHARSLPVSEDTVRVCGTRVALRDIRRVP